MSLWLGSQRGDHRVRLLPGDRWNHVSADQLTHERLLHIVAAGDYQQGVERREDDECLPTPAGPDRSVELLAIVLERLDEPLVAVPVPVEGPSGDGDVLGDRGVDLLVGDHLDPVPNPVVEVQLPELRQITGSQFELA